MFPIRDPRGGVRLSDRSGVVEVRQERSRVPGRVGDIESAASENSHVGREPVELRLQAQRLSHLADPQWAQQIVFRASSVFVADEIGRSQVGGRETCRVRLRAGGVRSGEQHPRGDERKLEPGLFGHRRPGARGLVAIERRPGQRDQIDRANLLGNLRRLRDVGRGRSGVVQRTAIPVIG